MAAPKGNKFAMGNNGGKPPLYESAEELSEAIDAYFEKVKELDSSPTITGLALHLGFKSRQSLYDYERKKEFAYIIKRGKLRVENSYELQLMSSSPTGSIFALKNMGWKDAKAIDHTSKGEKIGIDYSKLSENALEEIANAKSDE